jgi:hypothetical protein
LNAVVTHSLKAPGFKPLAWNAISWFQAFALTHAFIKCVLYRNLCRCTQVNWNWNFYLFPLWWGAVQVARSLPTARKRLLSNPWSLKCDIKPLRSSLPTLS